MVEIAVVVGVEQHVDADLDVGIGAGPQHGQAAG